MSRIAHLVTACLVAGCVTATAPLPGETVSADYTVSGGEWNQGGTISVLVRAFQSDGNVAFCGVWTTAGAPAIASLYDGEVVSAASLFIAGRSVILGLSALPQAPSRADMTGTATACGRTDEPWQPEFAGAPAQVRFPRMIFEGDDDGDYAPLIFREAPVPRIIG